MAELVIGIGTSHSPQMNTPAEMWELHAQRDRANEELWFRRRKYRYSDLEPLMDDILPDLPDRLSPEVWEAEFQRAQEATNELKKKLLDSSPDVVVVVANDHREMIEVNLPALTVYWGSSIESIPIPREEVPESIRPALHARQREFVESYPCGPELGLHLIRYLTEAGFDVTEMSVQPPGRGIGHGFTHVRLQLMDELIPMVPVILNSYYPPNQPTASRCVSLGAALRQAISNWDGSARVAVVASGGLSHFVVDEEWDHALLEALQQRDWSYLSGIADDEMMQGTAEVRHWITAGVALEELDMQVVDYVPAYRSRAGTGCGLGFVVWS